MVSGPWSLAAAFPCTLEHCTGPLPSRTCGRHSPQPRLHTTLTSAAARFPLPSRFNPQRAAHHVPSVPIMCAQGGIFSKKEVRLLVAGLDSAGKTSTRPKLAAVKSFEIAAMKEDGCRARWPPHVCMCVHSAAASPMYALSHTAIFYKLKHGKRRLAEPVNTIPTLDFNVDSCRHRTHSSHTCTTLHIHTCIHVCVCIQANT